jgi:hypothetical protein
VYHQPFRRGLVAAPGLQEGLQGVAQPGVRLVVGGQAAQRAVHPGPEQVGGPEHHRYGRDLAERHRPRRRSGGQRDRLGGDGLLMGETEPSRPASRVAEGEMNVGVHPGRAGSRGVERVPDAQR